MSAAYEARLRRVLAYIHDNPAGDLRELWYHEQGDRSWLVVTRNTLTHAISKVEMARDVARTRGRST